MTIRNQTHPIGEDLLGIIADLVKSHLGSGIGDDLAPGLVLLPSARACRDLGHRFLEQCPSDALLLPRILTPKQWNEELALRMGMSAARIPDDRTRSLVLARRLEVAPWIEHGTENAPGLAEECVAFFDEVRLHRLDGLLLNSTEMDGVLERVPEAEAEIFRSDLERLRMVWHLYREDFPDDAIDVQTRVAESLGRGDPVPGVRPALTVVAGFGRVDPVRGILLKAALDQGETSFLLTPEYAAPLDHLLAATWPEQTGSADPLATTRRLMRMLTPGPEPDPIDDDTVPPLRVRLEVARATLGPLDGSAPEIHLLENPEDEARFAAARTADWIENKGGPGRGVTIATQDPQLAARITARLRDAGLDADNTVGEPVAAQPAGLLVRFLLRAALTDLRDGPLLEVLTHPYTHLEAQGLEGSPRLWALRLERMFREESAPQEGLATLLRRARENDRIATKVLQKQTEGMEKFLETIGRAFGPLLELRDEKSRPWATYLDALLEVWERVAPERPVSDGADQPDLAGLARLVTGLRGDADLLPATTLARFSTDLGRLLRSESAPAHRAQGIPITVTGLVEARLARSDLLILAGLNEGIFPSPAQATSLLPGPSMQRLGLPTWRETQARDAELFLRLLHGAPEVILTASEQREGQPVLLSSLLQRLQLALGLEPEDFAPVRVIDPVPDLPPVDRITEDEARFDAEPEAIPCFATARPFTDLSWTGLRHWRDCPYRFLLERGYALKAEEDVREEFGARDYGSLVHEILCKGMASDHPFYQALEKGLPGEAHEALAALAAEEFQPGGVEDSQRLARLHTFLDLVPELVRHEIRRFQDWRPVVRETGFLIPAGHLEDWIRARAAELDLDPGEALSPEARKVQLRGFIDRIDRATDGTGALAVLDYKTGSPPTPSDVRSLEDLQLALYVLAVELGTVEGVTGGTRSAAYYKLTPGAVGPYLNRGKPPLELDTEKGVELLVRGAQALLGLVLETQDPGVHFPVLPRHRKDALKGGLPCKWCDLRGVCRVEERDLGARVRQGLDQIVGRKEETG